jgi:hypothetical protein
VIPDVRRKKHKRATKASQRADGQVDPRTPRSHVASLRKEMWMDRHLSVQHISQLREEEVVGRRKQ